MELEAPAKVNLCLFLGGRRQDGLHRLVSLFEPIDLVDLVEVRVGEGGGEAGGDRVRFEFEPGVVGAPGGVYAVPSGAAAPGELERASTVHAALAEARRAGWGGPPCEVRVCKRIPIGAGLGGGSADAAAVLRWVASQDQGAGLGLDDGLAAMAARVGADVPSQIDPGFCLVGGAGEVVEPLRPLASHAFVLLADGGGLSTAEVFAEADRLGLGRTDEELDRLAERLRDALGPGTGPDGTGESPPSSGRSAVSGQAPIPVELFANDLEPAAISLRPGLADGLAALRSTGADHVAMTGSGATVFGVYPDRARAERAAAALGRDDSIVCLPLGRS